MSDPAPFAVQHTREQSRFLAELNGQQAVLDYVLSESSVDFTHTFVPPALRGNGVADKLVRSGLAWAREENLEISASCWYVRKFL